MSEVSNYTQKTEADKVQLTVLLPAYNEATTLAELLPKIKSVLDTLKKHYELLVVDDCSTDDTAAVAEKNGAWVIVHPYNKGNGASVKTGIRNAHGEIILLMDADGQHKPEDIPRLLSLMDHYDLVVGARNSNSHQVWHRCLANTIYNLFASYITGVKILDLTSGFRAVRADLARRFLYLLPNAFSYPTTMTVSFIKAGYNVAFVPISFLPREAGNSKIRLLSDGTRFFVILFKVATLFSPLKVFLPISISFLVAGVAYAIDQLILFHKFRNMAVVLLIFGISIFVLGLISEQIAQLRFERTED